MEYGIYTEGLSKRFGAVQAVQDLGLRVRQGVITAFLGPNGAGKTTTIRMLLGLLKSDAGLCEVLGHPPGHPKALAQLGAMVETPSLYGHLTGFENLEITRIMRDLPRLETSRVLAQVSLSRDAHRYVHTYSLGMRQRLGIALALMGEPKMLVLDEPTNGLDPTGIIEIRELIRRVPQETGAMVFISSHLLAEVEQVAQDVAVVHRGSLRYQGSLEALEASGPTYIRVRVDHPDRALAHFASKGLEAKMTEDAIHVLASPGEAPDVSADLMEAGLRLYELTPQRSSLEARFLSLLEGA